MQFHIPLAREKCDIFKVYIGQAQQEMIQVYSRQYIFYTVSAGNVHYGMFCLCW